LQEQVLSFRFQQHTKQADDFHAHRFRRFAACRFVHKEVVRMEFIGQYDGFGFSAMQVLHQQLHRCLVDRRDDLEPSGFLVPRPVVGV